MKDKDKKIHISLRKLEDHQNLNKKKGKRKAFWIKKILLILNMILEGSLKAYYRHISICLIKITMNFKVYEISKNAIIKSLEIILILRKNLICNSYFRIYYL